MTNSSKKNVLLVIPPYGDYTYPYHSISYLIPSLKKAGYCVDAIDLNIEWFNHIFNKNRLGLWRNEIRERMAGFENKSAWTIEDQEEAVKIVQSLAICDFLEPERTLNILKSDKFYDYEEYLFARNNIRQFERLLNSVYGGVDFFTSFSLPPGELDANALINRAVNSNKFIDDITGILETRFKEKRYVFCGVSMQFTSNLCLGFATLAAISKVFPDAFRVAGGTAISDIFKNKLSLETLRPFNKVCDHFIVGEADKTIIEYANWCLDDSIPLRPEVIHLNNLNSRDKSFQHQYVAIDVESDLPDYSWINWELYLSPEKNINYSPSRGCFWNKCTFCDYGLNDDSPTAPSRTIKPLNVLAHIKEIKALGIGNIYFAVDAITPAFLLKFAELLLEEDITIDWSGEFFLTKQFNCEMVEKLEKSGLVTASFGLESGSSRVLLSMGKGKDRVEQVLLPVFDAFRKSSIGLQPKFFFGFPGEDESDREKTVKILNENRDVFSIVTNWNVFDLTAGSIVAKEPEKFGITNIRRKSGDDIGGGMSYNLLDGSPPPNQSSFAHFDEKLNYFHAFERPWAGGIDTFHTKLYLKRYGKNIFHEISDRYQYCDDQTRPWIAGNIESRFDIESAFDNVLMYIALQSKCFYDKAITSLGEDDLAEALEEVGSNLLKGSVKNNYRIRFR